MRSSHQAGSSERWLQPAPHGSRPPRRACLSACWATLLLLGVLVSGCEGTGDGPASLPLIVTEAPTGQGKKGKSNQPPVAVPGGPYSTPDGRVRLNGSGSFDPNGPNAKLTFLWTLGDGASSTLKSPQHEYDAPGLYTVTLVVTDHRGLDSAPVSTTVAYEASTGQPPVADAGGPYQTTDGSITVDGTASDDPDGDNTELTYAWSFGDGSTGAGPTASHQFAEPGEYDVTLIVTDESGLESEPASTQAMYTETPNDPPVAHAGGPYETSNGSVAFDGSGSDDPDGSNGALTYAWEFGDGNTGTGARPTHTYSQFGTFPVSLRVTDAGGLVSSPATTTAAYLDDGGSGGGGTRTSVQSGPWESPSTWGGQSPPDNGDQAVVKHAVAVGTHVTVGRHQGGGGTVDLDIQPGGSVQVASGASLRVKGKVAYAGRIRVDGNAAFLMDAPAGQVYTMNIHPGAPLDAILEVRGFPGSPGVFDLNAGQGTGVLASALIVGNGVLDFEHGIFRGGDAGNLNGVQIRSGQHFRLVDSRVENSAGIRQLTTIASGGRVTVENSTWVGTVTSEALRLNRWDDPSSPGTTRFIHSVFDAVAFIEGPDALIDGCYMAQGLSTTGGATIYPRVTRNSLVRRTSASAMAITGDYVGNIHLEDHAIPNPHGLLLNRNPSGTTVSGNLFKYMGGNTEGDLIAPRTNNSTSSSLMVRENLVLLNGDGSGPSGTLVSLLGDHRWTVRIERNTYPSRGSSGGIAVAETYSGHAGYVPTINSNLAVGTSPGVGSIVHEAHSGIVSNYVSDASYNGIHNAGTAYDVAAHAFANPPGSGDVFGDPMFVDSTRDLDAYDLLHGGNGTVAHLLSQVARMNDPGFNPAFEPTAIRDWIRAGFRPQNAAFNGTGKNGVDIGAVSW